jgi:DNA-binding GntR family transcriptional regulator
MTNAREGLVRSPVTYQSKSSAVYAELRGRILDGSLPPSMALNQEQLAAELGVSTTPLREALRRLESEGLVTSLPHREAVVAALDFDDLLAVYEVRENLDALAVSLAAERHSEEDAKEIRRAMQRLLDSAGDDQLAVNRAFHAAIYRASHNPVLIELLDALWDRSSRYRQAVGFMAGDTEVHREHLGLVNAVLERRAEEGAALMRAHIRRTRSTFEEYYGRREESGGSSAP